MRREAFLSFLDYTFTLNRSLFEKLSRKTGISVSACHIISFCTVLLISQAYNQTQKNHYEKKSLHFYIDDSRTFDSLRSERYRIREQLREEPKGLAGL